MAEGGYQNEPPLQATVWQPQPAPGHKSRVRREDEPATGPYSHPVYKQVSLANGLINKMTKDQLKKKLADLKMDTRGHKDVLKKRLKNFYKDKKLVQAKVRKPHVPLYDYYIVIDFEATCDQFNPEGFRHEIIEFPVVLIDAHNVRVVDEFHAFVRPVINPKLSEFCTNLTGIKQSDVDSADTFDEVLARMEGWMSSHRLGQEKKFALITDGPWDMSRFMFLQCQWSRKLFPKWAKRWVNLRKAFCNFYRLRRAKLITMLENLGMDFEGHQHSGLDDTRNIARIAMRMLADGAELRFNEELFQDKREKNKTHAIVCPLKRNDLGDSASESDEDVDKDADSTKERLSANLYNRGNSASACADVQLCSVCRLEKCSDVTRQGEVAVRELSESLSRVSLNGSRVREYCQCQAEPAENYEDLLSYYALQKA